MNKLLLLYKACPLNHSHLDIKTKKVKAVFYYKKGNNYAFSDCYINDYFKFDQKNINYKDYRITSSYV